MPVDMALPLFRSKEDFVYTPPPKTCEPALSSGPDRSEDRAASRAASRADAGKTRKQVTFADQRGLSLTSVKVFSPFSDAIVVPLNLQQTPSSAPAAREDRLELDFAQPASDYLLLRQSLDRNLVCLERCVLTEAAMAGTVKVRNVSFEKSVKLRVTFDTWRSHSDVACEYLQDSFPSSYCDTFSFHVPLPAALAAHERVEFAVCYEVDGCEYWDSNHGNNYRIVWSSRRSPDRSAWSRSASFDFGIHFDRYGSPTCSHGILPDWPSYAGYENSGPYY